MKTWQGWQLINFRWEDVAQALWMRYPNSCSPHVSSEDTLSRHRQGRSLLCSSRLFTKRSVIPQWAARHITRTSFVHVIEHSVVDVDRKLFVTVTENLNQRTSMCVTERCIYSAADPDPSATPTANSLFPANPAFPQPPSAASKPGMFSLAAFSRKKTSELEALLSENCDAKQADFANSTLVKREVWVTSQRTGFKAPLEAFGKQRYKINVKKTLDGLVEVLNRLKRDSKLWSSASKVSN